MKLLNLKAGWLTLYLGLCLSANLPNQLYDQDISVQCATDSTVIESLDPATDFDRMLACPRCRKAKPPGPKKRPNPTVEEISVMA